MLSCLNILSRRSKSWLIISTLSGASLCGCGGGSGSPPPPPPPVSTITSVTVSPGSASLVVKATQQFTATVQGTGNFSTAVGWYVNGVQGGNSTVGTITAGGLYTAPDRVPDPSMVTVTAKSTQDSSKSGSSATSINAENVQISISPASVSLQLGGAQQFNVTVSGTVNQSINWTINGQPSSVSTPWGTISQDGSYTTPSLLPVNPVVTLTATSVEDPSKSASAVATIQATAGGITVTITPSNPQVVFDGSKSIQFTAAVSGTANTSVTWSTDAGAGNITPDGVFTPLTFNCTNAVPTAGIHATSAANPGAQAATTVNLVPPSPVITQLSPQPAAAETTLQMTGTFAFGASGTVLFPGPNGTQIPSALGVTSPTTASVNVPLGSSSGSLTIEQDCSNGSSGVQFPPQHSAPIGFQRLPRLRIRADRKDLAAGESVQLHAVPLGDPTPLPIQWGSGISSSGVYTAPAKVASESFVTLSGCIQNTNACDSLMLRLSPLRIDPPAPSVADADTLQLSAMTGGSEVVPSWNIVAGGGGLLSNGLYTAPKTLEDSGPVLVSASYAGSTAQASIGVTGSYPGLINRVYDYIDRSAAPAPNPTTIASSLAVGGNLAYVLSVDTPEQLATPKYCWIDVYDITDAAHPVWLDAAEALNTEPSSILCWGSLYTYGGLLYEVLNGEIAGEIAQFAVLNGHLSLQHVYTIPHVDSFSFNQGIFYAIADIYHDPGIYGGAISAYLFDVRNGTMVQTSLNLPRPQPGVTAQIFTPVGKDNLIYFLVNQPGPPATAAFKVAVYDTSASPPTLAAAVDAMVGANQPAGGTLAIVGNSLLDGWDIYDISIKVPSRIGTSQFNIQAVNSTGSLAVSGNFTLDVSNPSSPAVKSYLDDGFGLWDQTWVGDLMYAIEGGGLGVYSTTGGGGQIPLDALPNPGVYGAIFSQIVNGNILYTVQQSDGPFLTVYDLSASSPNLLGTYNESGQSPLSLALLNKSLFVGTLQGLLVLDVSSPGSPAKVASAAFPSTALAVSGNSLFAGTTDNQLVVLDVTNPASPAKLTQVGLPDTPINFRVAGNLLYIADNTAGLLIYSIANVSSPVLVSQYKLSSAIGDIALDGNLALLAAAESGLVILDVTNPAAPVLVSETLVDAISCAASCLNPVATAVAVDGGLVYVGSSGNMYGKVFAFDYRVPAHPRLVSMMSYGGALDEAVYNFAFYQSRMFVGGSLFVVADRQSDISQPRNVINLYYQNFSNGSGASLPAASRTSSLIRPKIRPAVAPAR
jgi:hypothetical protein